MATTVDMNRCPISRSRKAYLLAHGLDPNDSNAWSNKWGNLRDRHKNNLEKLCKLSFEDYIDLALLAGITKPDQIGVKRGSYQLGRHGDVGPYEIGNCRFITMEQNRIESGINGGEARRADKIRGRTKENNEGIRLAAQKKEGRTQENHEGTRRSAELRKGQPNKGVSEKLTGRSVSSHPYIRNTALKNSNHYKVVSPDGVVYEGINLKEFCEAYGLLTSQMYNLCLGKIKLYKGWTGEYTYNHRETLKANKAASLDLSIH